MKKMKKIIAAFLAMMYICLPVAGPSYTAYASVTAAGVITAGGYVVHLLLDACGIYLSLSSLSSLIGEWDTLQEYEQLGAEGKLGAFSQHLYDKTHSGETEEALSRGKAAEEALVNAMSSSWGATIENLDPLLKELKDYLGYCYGYGTADTTYYVPAVPETKTWGVTGWSAREFFPLPTTPAVLVPPVANNADYTLFLTSYVAGYTSADMNVQNWYYETAKDLFGVYDASTKTLETYERNPSDATYRTYYCTAYSAYAYEDGSLKYSVTSTDWWKRSTIYCSPADAGALPFPVFGSLSAAMDYVETGAKGNVYVPGTLPLDAEADNKTLQKIAIKSVGALTIPASADAAQNALTGVQDAYATDTALKSAIGDAGLAIDWGEEGTGAGDKDKTETDTLLKQIADAITALPLSIAQAVADKAAENTEEEEDNYRVSSVVIRKFPFCIPFDLIHCLSVFSAEKVDPIWHFPFVLKSEALGIDYEQDIVLDLTREEFARFIFLFRYLVLIGFILTLITITRNIIKG